MANLYYIPRQYYYVGPTASTSTNPYAWSIAGSFVEKPHVPTEKERLSSAATQWAYEESKGLAKQA